MAIWIVLTGMAALAAWFVYQKSFGIAAEIALCVVILVGAMITSRLDKLIELLAATQKEEHK